MMIFRRIGVSLLFVAFAVIAANAQTGGAKGKVRNPKGQALAGVEITARLDGKDVKSVKSDSKGNFEISGLDAGVYNFVFEKTGFAAGIKYGVKISSGDTVNLGDNLALAVDNGTLILINGSVYNQGGRSITGAKIEIEKIASDGSAKKIATTYTNASGEFTLRQPDAAAKFRVTASMKGVKGSKEITVESAGVYRLAITLTLPVEE